MRHVLCIVFFLYDHILMLCLLYCLRSVGLLFFSFQELLYALYRESAIIDPRREEYFVSYLYKCRV